MSGAGDLDPDFRRKEYRPRHLEPSSAGVRVWRKSYGSLKSGKLPLLVLHSL